MTVKPDMKATIVYVTAASVDEARAIARDLVERKLAACANIFPSMTSVYRWEGAVQEEQETAIILKTRAEKIDALSARVKEIHSYDCPCVVALPVDGGNQEFLSWILRETE